MKLSHVLEELVEERGIDRAVLNAIIAEGMLSAYQKKYPNLELAAKYNKKTNEVGLTIHKKVVPTPSLKKNEIGLRKAKGFKKTIKVGDSLWVPFEGKIGRIEIMRARQVIAQKIRSIEAEQIYKEFKPKEGMLVYGSVHKCERGGISVKIQDAFAFLPKSLTIPGERCAVGYPIRAILKEVLLEPRNENQLILDRSSREFLKALFDLEIPEVFERIVEIKKIVRVPGYKSKVVVSSNDPNIDPVGTCVGVGGARVKPILRELGTEKIDVIAEHDSTEQLVKDSLKPAVIDRVAIEGGVAKVWLQEDQRSMAIGKMGKNISLASELTGLEINLVQEETSVESEKMLADVFGESEEE